jgi:hypothetical protein
MQDETLGEDAVYSGRRRHGRRVAFPLGTSALGKIFVDEAFIRSCTLHNISAGGACLQVYQPQDIPNMFHLVLDALNLKKPCRVVWRSRDKIGVEFSPAPLPEPAWHQG